MSFVRANIRLQAIVLITGTVLMGLKFWAWEVTHSNAILSDALESIVNVVAGAFALYSLILAAKPRDREHPYGHGKVEFISAGIEGSLIAFAGLIIIYRAVHALITGNIVHDIDQGLVLITIAGVLNLLLGFLLKRRGRQQHSITMEAGGEHLLSDAWNTAAMLIGLVLIKYTGRMWIDSAFAMAFGAFIIFQGTRVVMRSVSGIMDRTDMAVATDLVRILETHRKPGWIDIHNFRVIAFGRTLHIDCHVTLPYYWTLERSHSEINSMDDLINDRSGREVELFIHTDPCVPTSCPICLVSDCPVRRSPFTERITWTLESALANEKHERSTGNCS